MKKEINNILKGLFYLFPSLIIIGTFQIYPSIKVFLLSTYTEYNYMKHIVLNKGIDNFINIFNDPNFIISIKNTLILVVCIVPLSIIVSLFLSLLMYKKTKFRDFIRSIYFLPFITSTVAISVVWRWIFNSKTGILNYLLSLFNIKPINWLTDPQWAMVALVILSVWKTMGYNILILVTGLRSIDEKYYQAARVDGATERIIVRTITIPLLSPSLLFVSITSMIGAFKVFQEVYALFNKTPGPLKSCLTMVYYIYDKLINHYSYGMAAAASVVLFIIILIITFLQWIIMKRKVFYR